MFRLEIVETSHTAGQPSGKPLPNQTFTSGGFLKRRRVSILSCRRISEGGADKFHVFAALEALLGPRGVTLPEIQIEGVSLKIGPHVRSRGRSASKAVVCAHRGGGWMR